MGSKQLVYFGAAVPPPHAYATAVSHCFVDPKPELRIQQLNVTSKHTVTVTMPHGAVQLLLIGSAFGATQSLPQTRHCLCVPYRLHYTVL